MFITRQPTCCIHMHLCHSHLLYINAMITYYYPLITDCREAMVILGTVQDRWVGQSSDVGQP